MLSGGLKPNDTAVPEVDLLDPNTVAFKSRLPPMPEPRSAHCSAFYDNRLWMIGGRAAESTLNDAWTFDDTTQKWVQLPQRMLAYHAFAAACIWRDKMVITSGAAEHYRNTAICEYYDRIDQKWHPLPSLPDSRHHHMAFSIEDELVLVGGMGLHTVTLQLNANQTEWVVLLSLPLPEKPTRHCSAGAIAFI